MLEAVVIVIAVVAAAASGALFKPGPWYEGLAKPAWTPPNWAFPVVWTILYVLIAWSGWLVWQAEGPGLAMTAWIAQLVLNAAWSWLFFGLRRMDLAMADVLALLAAILAYIALAAPVSALAAMLFVPYAVWVATAATLNLSVWRLNAEAGGRA